MLRKTSVSLPEPSAALAMTKPTVALSGLSFAWVRLTQNRLAMAQLSFRRMWYVGCRSPINVWPVMRHQAGMSACAPRSRAVRRRICPGCIASRRRRSSSTRSPQPRSPASQWASAGRGAGVLVLMGRRALRWRSLSHAQVARLELLVAEQLLRPGLVHDPPLAHEINVIGDAERERQILLDDEDRRTAGLELPD